MKSWDEFRAEVRERKRARWLDILQKEEPGRLPGRRPRDPEQEALLTELDRNRVRRSELLRGSRRESGSD